MVYLLEKYLFLLKFSQICGQNETDQATKYVQPAQNKW